MKKRLLFFLIALSLVFSFTSRAQVPEFDNDKPATTFYTKYTQTLSTGIDFTKFNTQWQTHDFTIGAGDVSAGYFQFQWVPKRVLRSKSAYAIPYTYETDIDYAATDLNGGGMIIRVNAAASGIEDLQEPPDGVNGFNREGIAIFPTIDGNNMTIQFSGTLNGPNTPSTRILIPKPDGVASLLSRGTIKIEDFGTSVYVYYNGTPFARINLGGLSGSNYTSGTVYDANMVNKGSFTDMEVADMGSIAVAARQFDVKLYSAAVQTTEVIVVNNDATLSNISTGCVDVDGFSPSVMSYNVSVPYAFPAVVATTTNSEATYQTTITNGVASIVVTAADGTTQLTYTLTFQVNPVASAFDNDKPARSFIDNYAQTINAAMDFTTFNTQWQSVDAVTAGDVAAGYLQFKWVEKRIIGSRNAYTTPYTLETEIEYGSASNRGGVVIRLDAITEDIQETASGDPGFNRDGIAFYPSFDGSAMIVQFTGIVNGASTPVTRISVPKPCGLTSLLGKGILTIEDFGTSIFVYYNGGRFIRIDLGEISGTNYTSGTVYDANMASMGTFTGMEVAITGKVAIGQRDASLRLYNARIKTVAPWDNRPETTFEPKYSQVFNTSWDNTAFYAQWETIDANTFVAEDIANGYLQFVWPAKRVMYSKSVYASPYSIESEIDYSAGSSRGGVVIRASAVNMEDLQEPASGDPGFNREGIAFYTNDDGSSMTVQFTGTNNGASTPVTRISVPKPVDVTSLRDRGILRVEDYGTSVYVFYNNAPYIRIDLGDKIGENYTSGTVYDAAMQVVGTFTGMEVAVLGKVAVAQRDAALRLYSVDIKTKKADVPWDIRPATTLVIKYSQVFNTEWNNTTFYNQWETMEPAKFGAADIANGYLQFVFPAKRIIYSKSIYASPYSIESDLDFSAGSSRAGVVLRAYAPDVLTADFIQEPKADPGFNREGIAFYPTDDGYAMNVQFSGVESGQANTAVTTIQVPKPSGVTSLRERGTLRIEDYGTSVYVFYNNAPYIRIDLGDLVGESYTSGTVYDAAMHVAGTFTGMEVAVSGKVAVAQRDAALKLYSVVIKELATVPDAPTNVTAVSGSKQATVSFSAPLNDGGLVVTKYTVISSPGNFRQTGTSSPLVVTRLVNGTAYTFTVIATNEIGNSAASAPSNSVTPANIPDAPKDVIASATNKQATVSFTAPAVNGGSEIINYTVTSTPGNFTQTGTSSPILVEGLTNGTAYTFTVIATNKVGNSVESAISNEVTPLDNTAVKDYQPTAIKVYQTGSSLVVDLNGLNGVQHVYLIDILGKPVVSKQAFGNEKLEISNRLTSGVYFVRVQGANKTQVMKIIVK